MSCLYALPTWNEPRKPEEESLTEAQIWCSNVIFILNNPNARNTIFSAEKERERDLEIQKTEQPFDMNWREQMYVTDDLYNRPKASAECWTISSISTTTNFTEGVHSFPVWLIIHPTPHLQYRCRRKMLHTDNYQGWEIERILAHRHSLSSFSRVYPTHDYLYHYRTLISCRPIQLGKETRRGIYSGIG